MSPIQAILKAGDRADDVIGGAAAGTTLAGPLLAFSGAPGMVPEISVTSGAVLVLLTACRMLFGHLKDRETRLADADRHRHEEAVIRLRIEEHLARRVAPTEPFDDPDKAD